MEQLQQTNINIVELLRKKRERDLETIVKEVIDRYFVNLMTVINLHILEAQ